jgi:hypothetical protein
MFPKKAFRFVTPLHILIATLPICSLPLYAQHLSPRVLRGEAAGAAAAKAATHAATAGQAFTLPPPTAVGTFVTFDVPGAVNGTSPTGTNNSSAITGSYGDNVGSGSHGFVRDADGSFVTFDVAGAVNGTFPFAINDNGVVAGSYFDNVGIGVHGFVRSANSAIVTFDIPDAAPFFAFTGAINARGEVAGSYVDGTFTFHSFLREPNGMLTTFDPPGVVGGSLATAITPNGIVLGVSNPFGVSSSFDSGPGFTRTPSGTFTQVTGPGGLGGQFDFDTLFRGAALSSNPGGEIAGTFFEPIAGNPFGGNFRVFLLSKDGQYTTFDGADYPPCCIWSAPSGINPAGTVTGSLNDGFNVTRGFLRTKDGKVATFDAPGAGTGPLGFQGTFPIGITPGGVIAGAYTDATFLSHGFLFYPR